MIKLYTDRGFFIHQPNPVNMMWHFENSVMKLTIIEIGLNRAVNNSIDILKWASNDVTTIPITFGPLAS